MNSYLSLDRNTQMETKRDKNFFGKILTEKDTQGIFSSASRVGRAREDRVTHFLIKQPSSSEPIRVYGVYDGHGSDFVSSYLVHHMPAMLSETMRNVKFHILDEVQEAVVHTFYLMDRQLHDLLLEIWLTRDFDRLERDFYLPFKMNRKKNFFSEIYMESQKELGVSEEELRENFFQLHGGSTAVLAMHLGDYLYLVNLGDSRGIYFDERGAVYTVDHKPDNPEEKRRIESLGSYVTASRVGGILALSRAFGDFYLKKVKGSYTPYGPVSAMPDIYFIRTQPDGMVLLASDGLTDALSTEEIYNFLKEKTRETASSSSSLTKSLHFTIHLIEEACDVYEKIIGGRGHLYDISVDDISLIIARVGK